METTTLTNYFNNIFPVFHEEKSSENQIIDGENIPDTADVYISEVDGKFSVTLYKPFTMPFTFYYISKSRLKPFIFQVLESNDIKLNSTEKSILNNGIQNTISLNAKNLKDISLSILNIKNKQQKTNES